VLTASLGPKLARQRGVLRAIVLRILVEPLALLTQTGDRIAVRLVRSKD
jgi:hypothetical protein